MPGYVVPSGPGVEVTAPSKLIVEELRIKTTDTGYARPGALVVRDTDDNHCKVCTSGDTGILGFILPKAGLDVTTDFTTEDVVSIGHGEGAIVALPWDNTLAVTKGDALYAGLHGKVFKAAGTDVTKIVGYAEKSKAISTTGLLLVRLAK